MAGWHFQKIIVHVVHNNIFQDILVNIFTIFSKIFLSIYLRNLIEGEVKLTAVKAKTIPHQSNKNIRSEQSILKCSDPSQSLGKHK